MTATLLRALETGGLLAFAFSACGNDTTVTTVTTKDLGNGTTVVTKTKGDGKAGASAIARNKRLAQDTEAKSTVRLAQTMMEIYYTDHQSYSGANTRMLVSSEPLLARAGPSLSVSDISREGYTVSIDSENAGTNFAVTKDADAEGEVFRSCSKPGSDGCGIEGDW